MSHYNAQREEHIKHLEETFGKKAHVTPGQKGAYLCPPGTYLDLTYDECKWDSGELGRDAEFARKVDTDKSYIPKPLKETEGKAHGARYCFLGDIADVMDDNFSKLGEALSLIVSGVENNNLVQAKFYCYEVMHLLSDEHSMNDLIGVRAQALSSGKYTFESYREEIDVNLLLDAAARHFLKILFVSNIDEESGYPHTAHLLANVIMIHTQLNLHKK